MEKTNKVWASSPWECPKCGDTALVLTNSKKPDWFYDGDEVRCADSEKCDAKGVINVWDEDCADVLWDDSAYDADL